MPSKNLQSVVLPQVFCTYSFDNLIDSQNLRSRGSISLKNILIFPKNFLEKQGIIKLSSCCSRIIFIFSHKTVHAISDSIFIISHRKVCAISDIFIISHKKVCAISDIIFIISHKKLCAISRIIFIISHKKVSGYMWYYVTC